MENIMIISNFNKVSCLSCMTVQGGGGAFVNNSTGKNVPIIEKVREFYKHTSMKGGII